MSAKTAASHPKVRPFPGGSSPPEPGELRIAIEKKPYAEIIGHAVLEPDVEVCGVLVGTLEQDEHGPWVHVAAAIKGEAAKQQGAQVTFTHETWNHIHREIDQNHASKQIIGWYHTHGGFGIFLSEMDTFIHKNFFSEPHHIAYVFDPLAGSEGFFHPHGGELKPARRYWLAGRERKIAARPAPDPAAEAPGSLAPAVNALQRAAASLQVLAARQGDAGGASWPWLLAAALAGFLGCAVLGGWMPGALAPLQGQGRGLVLLLERDAAGRAAGVEVKELQREEGLVYRDRSGRLFLGLEQRAADGTLAPLPKLGLDSVREEPPRPPPPDAAAAPRGRPLLTAALAAGAAAAVLAAAGLGAWLWRRRTRSS